MPPTRPARYWPRTVLVGDIAGVEVPQGRKHFDLLGADGVGVHGIGRFHRRQAEQLHDVVLHHVAERAGLVVIIAAAFDADLFGHRDLHVIDGLARPDRLHQHVGEAEHEQVLHRLLAEIVVDAENPLFVEDGADAVIDLARGSEIAADRLFEDDARVRRRELGFAQTLGDRRKQIWRGGQIEDADIAGAIGQLLLQRAPLRGRRHRIERDIVDVLQKFGALGFVDADAGRILGLVVVHDLAEGVGVHRRARSANNARLRRDLPV